MTNHKSKIAEKECQCNKCALRFSCFTGERIFSDPLYQGLYEALIAQGRTKEQALDEVSREMKINMKPIPVYPPVYQPASPNVSPYTWDTGAAPYDPNRWTITCDNTYTYTMSNGEKISWKVDNASNVTG